MADPRVPFFHEGYQSHTFIFFTPTWSTLDVKRRACAIVRSLWHNVTNRSFAMRLKFYWIVYRKHCLLVLFTLVLLAVATVLISRAGDLTVAQVPQIQDTHFQRANEILTNNETHHVIIVGAGASGMSAAYTLEYLNLSYTVLEAGATFGGRVQEMNDFIDDVPLDLGAEWIHVMPRVLQDLLLFPDDDAAGSIEIIDYQPETYKVYKRGRQRRRNVFALFYNEYKFFNTTWWSYFADYFYPYIADHVIFDAKVQDIQYNANDDDAPTMTVTTSDGRQFKGSHVIVATPARILQDRDITFVPDLEPSTWEVIDSIDIADGMKVWFEWDEDFYPDMQFTESILRGAEGQPSYFYFDGVWGKPTDRHVLCVFNVNEDKAREQASWSDEEIVQFYLEKLQEIQGRSNLQAKLKQTRVQNWSREPDIRGAYTWNYGDYDQEKLRKPLQSGHLFLAGEYVALGDEYVATVHGAAITGREAVLQILSQQSNG